MLGSMSKWIYDKSPTDALKFEEPLAELKAQINESGSKVFQDMIRNLLLDNSHRTTVEMYPSKTLEEEQLKVRICISFICMRYGFFVSHTTTYPTG